MEQTITEAAVTPQGGKRLAGGGKKIPLIILGAVLAAVLAVYLGLCGWACLTGHILSQHLLERRENRRIDRLSGRGADGAGASPKDAGILPAPCRRNRRRYFRAGGRGFIRAGARCHRHLRGAGPYPNAGLYGRCGVCAAGGPEKPLLFQRGWDYLVHLFGWRGSAAVPLEPDDAVFKAGWPPWPAVFPRAPGHLF